MTTDDDAWASADADSPATVAGSRWTPPPGGALRSSAIRRALVVTAAVAPWIVVGAYVGLPSGDADLLAPAGPAATDASGPADTLSQQAFSRQALPTPSDDPTIATQPGAVATTTLPPDADSRLAALAIEVAHLSLASLPGADVPTGLTAGPRDRYVDHASVERVVHRSAGAAIVIVSAVVLRADGDIWGGSMHVRLAVPLVFIESSPVPAGAPWLLPTAELEVSTPESTLIDDPALGVAAHAAVIHAGYSEVEVTAVTSSDVWPVIAHVVARAPDETSRREHTIWLERIGQAIRVVGVDSSPDRPANGSNNTASQSSETERPSP